MILATFFLFQIQQCHSDVDHFKHDADSLLDKKHIHTGALNSDEYIVLCTTNITNKFYLDLNVRIQNALPTCTIHYKENRDPHGPKRVDLLGRCLLQNRQKPDSDYFDMISDRYRSTIVG